MKDTAYACGLVQRLIEQARMAAIHKHGPLQGGMKRWAHHLREECEEAAAEMAVLDARPLDWDARLKLMTELAQVSQLAREMMVMLFLGTEREGEETWKR